MPNPWFRLYHEWDSDPKVQAMSEPMQRRLIMLFCSKCRGETLHETDRAFHWRISPQELAETKALFVAKGFIDENWDLPNWNKRQFLSDSSTDRVRRHRINKGVKQDETLQVVTVKQSVTAPDTDTDTDTEQKKPSPSAKKTALRRAKKKQASPPTKTDFATTRHKEFKVAIFEYWKSRNTVDCPWGQPEGQQLEIWLRASPNVTIGQFKEMLRNRYRSTVNHADRPSRWIKNVTSYAVGPLDQFGHPLNGNGAKPNGRLDKHAQMRRDDEELFGAELTEENSAKPN